MTVDPSASLTIADVDVDGDLTFAGSGAETGYRLIRMNRPAFTPRVTRADPSHFTAGSLPTGGVPEESLLTALVELTADTQVEIETMLARVKTAVYRRTYAVTQEWNAASNNFTGTYGSVTPGEIGFVELKHLRQLVSISIPLPKGAA